MSSHDPSVVLYSRPCASLAWDHMGFPYLDLAGRAVLADPPTRAYTSHPMLLEKPTSQLQPRFRWPRTRAPQAK